MAVETDREIAPQPGGPVFWSALVVGWAVIAFGLVGIVTTSSTQPRSLAIWVIGSLLAHDLVIAPIAFIVAGRLRRIVPSKALAAVQVALVISAMLALVAFPFAGGFGARPDDPTLLPRNYATGLAIAIGVVWVVSLIGLVVSWRRAREQS